jgi:ABC-type nitrate/sulfonate/bicarbonate transport system permease component
MNPPMQIPSQGLGTRRRSNVWRVVGLGLAFPVAVVVLWQVLASAGVLSKQLFSEPSAIAGQLGPEIEAGDLPANILATLRESVVGYVLAAIPGLLIGLAMGLWRRVDYALEPLVIGLYSAPVVALYPLLILWFGIGFSAIVVLVILFTIFPIIVNTALGVRLVDPVLVRTATSFGASRREMLLKVILPAALPSIVSGLQLAVGRCFTGAVVAELFIGTAGLGYAIGYYANYLQMDAVFLNIFVIGIIGVTATLAMGRLERRFHYC